MSQTNLSFYRQNLVSELSDISRLASTTVLDEMQLGCRQTTTQTQLVLNLSAAIKLLKTIATPNSIF